MQDRGCEWTRFEETTANQTEICVQRQFGLCAESIGNSIDPPTPFWHHFLFFASAPHKPSDSNVIGGCTVAIQVLFFPQRVSCLPLCCVCAFACFDKHRG